ncbi:hypothetical protein BC833DRAFT_195767 [Globomyces pollinis-pini]|nr:hypothetical protein BC833DRAFT_195767 [Globomyces pollinis-pini]
MIYTITSDINKNRSSFTTIDSKLNSIELLNSPDNDTIINLFTYLHSINSSNSIQKPINDEQHPFEYTDSFSMVSELVSSKLLQLEIPDSIHLLHNLTRIELIKCQLYGPLTESICSLPSLTYLNLSFNHLTGNIPTQIGDLSDLLYLNLSNNSFAGDFPSSVNKLTKLSHLLLNNNCLDGDIPDCFHNLNKLKVFNIEHNKFSFRLPDSLLNLQNMYSIKISP